MFLDQGGLVQKPYSHPLRESVIRLMICIVPDHLAQHLYSVVQIREVEMEDHHASGREWFV